MANGFVIWNGYAKDQRRCLARRCSKPLDRIAEIAGLPHGTGVEVVPEHRVVELARYGLAGKTSLLKRHPRARRHAILLASVRYLHRRAVDDALELLDELVTNELIGNAVRSADRGVIREHSRMASAASSLAAVVRVLQIFCLAVSSGMAEEDFAFELLGSTIVWYGTAYKPYIESIRETNAQPLLYGDLLYVAERWRNRLEIETDLVAATGYPFFGRSRRSRRLTIRRSRNDRFRRDRSTAKP